MKVTAEDGYFVLDWGPDPLPGREDLSLKCGVGTLNIFGSRYPTVIHPGSVT